MPAPPLRPRHTPTLSTLPPELLLLILSNLPIASLLSFGLTNRANHTLSLSALTSLRLAIFPKRVHALIAFLETWGSETAQPNSTPQTLPHNHVPIILRPPPTFKPGVRKAKSSSSSSSSRFSLKPAHEPLTSLTTTEITLLQNTHLTHILSQYGPSLQDLEFLAYDLTAPGARALSTHLPSCKRLALRFSHPHVRSRDVDRSFWETPSPGSTLWNYLGGVEKDDRGFRNESVLRNLEVLILERCGVTGWQLQKVVEGNGRLRELKLKNCSGVDVEFLNWLGRKWAKRGRLEVLWLQKCEGVDDGDGLRWVDGLTGLKVCAPLL
jgi:hypothetical protein